MSLTLHGFPESTTTRKVVWMLHELGVEHRFVHVDILAGAQRAPEYAALNPMLKVPTLVDGDFVLWESNAIVEYLAEKHASPLLPADLRARARARQWMGWQAAHFVGAVEGAFLPRFYAARGAPFDEAAWTTHVEIAAKLAGVLDRALRARPWLAGEDFSIADIAVGETASLCAFAGVGWDDLPSLTAWFARLEARPAFVRSRIVSP